MICDLPPDGTVVCFKGTYGRLLKMPSEVEILENPRARSAIMRVAEKRLGSVT
jgi:16S rRNA C1402 N4-methylase RsmH